MHNIYIFLGALISTGLSVVAPKRIKFALLGVGTGLIIGWALSP